MSLDIAKMRADRAASDKPKSTLSGPEFLRIEEGEILLYICPPVHADEGTPYVEAKAHYGFGPNNRMITCFLSSINQPCNLLTSDVVNNHSYLFS